MPLTPEERRQLWNELRVPTYAFAALMLLLAVNVGLGAFLPFHHVWVVQLAVATAMVTIVLLFSMEVIDRPPLIRFFAVLGFFWVFILFAMTLVDYLSR